VETDKRHDRLRPCDRRRRPLGARLLDDARPAEEIDVKDREARVHKDVPMWRFWQLEEGVLQVRPETLLTDDGEMPPVLHVDTDAPLYSDVDGSLITDQMWGIYYKPDWHFNGVQGGASPYKVEKPADDVAIDPYGPASPEFVSSDHFAHMWVSALAHCHKRFHGMMPKYHREPSGGIGCFTADSFPVFDHFNENVAVIADSNHGYKMLGVGPTGRRRGDGRRAGPPQAVPLFAVPDRRTAPDIEEPVPLELTAAQNGLATGTTHEEELGLRRQGHQEQRSTTTTGGTP
jgi:hypothetical protein